MSSATDLDRGDYRANILAVDDRRENLDALVEVLAPLGHNILCAQSGEEALKCLLQHECAVILLDVRMPGMDGFETAAHIKSRERTRHIPIIFLTALEADPYHALRGYSEGGVDYIAKPFDPWMLRSKVTVFVELDVKNHILRRQADELSKRNLELAELADAAEAASRSKSAFLNMAGHELRTPLAVIMGYTSLLLADAYGTPPEEFERPLSYINDKVTELGTLVESILDAAKIEAEAVFPEPGTLDLDEAAKEAVERAQPRASLLNGAIELQLSSAGAAVVADAQQVGRVLDNLINNALSYGGDNPRVSVAVDGGSTPRVTVHDSGVGIAEGSEDRIFDRFVRGFEPGTGPAGTGLGLYICRDLARRNGGDVTLQHTRPGEGSTFVLSFAAPAPQARPAHGQPLGATVSPPPSPRALSDVPA